MRDNEQIRALHVAHDALCDFCPRLRRHSRCVFGYELDLPSEWQGVPDKFLPSFACTEETRNRCMVYTAASACDRALTDAIVADKEDTK